MTDKDAARFWKKVDKSAGPDACWPWTAYSIRGYGQIRLGKSHANFLAHRVSWSLCSGRLPRDGMYICHTCHNPGCCNPNHLYEGTPKQNTADSIRIGTFAASKRAGELNPSSKLSEANARDIVDRLERGETCASIQRRYPFVSYSAIKHIKLGASWRSALGRIQDRI